MPMAAAEIEALIRAGIPDAHVEITDLAGDGDHYSARVVPKASAANPASPASAASTTRWAAAWRRAPRAAAHYGDAGMRYAIAL
jgi:hypothetical protein